MKKNNKAFTLIELLAVIIIIGLLAVLIIPRINSTIKDSRRNAGELSAKALVRESDNFYLTKRGSGESFEECTYNFNSNTNTCSGFEFSGEKPDSGLLKIRKDGTVALAIQFDDYCYIKKYNSDDITTIYYDEETCTIEESHIPQYGDNVKFDESETYIAEIYLDPEDLSKKCTEAEALQNSVTGKNTGCMRWFAYKEDDDTFTMILDHNTTASSIWKNSRNNSEGPGNQSKTEIGTKDNEVLYDLQQDTQGWSEELFVPEIYKPSLGNFNWTVDYSKYGNRARLISAEEIAEITKGYRAKGNSTTEDAENPWTLGSSWFLLDKGTIKCHDNYNCDTEGVISKYWWLYDNTEGCTIYGCKTAQSGNWGYLTSSPNTDYSYTAWAVYYEGFLGHDDINFGVYGVRPVIKVSKSLLQ